MTPHKLYVGPKSDCQFLSLIHSNPTMVTIYVGPTKEKWVLHESMLCNQLAFFKGAFQGSFYEGSSKTMNLEEDDPVVFKMFVDYLYNSKVFCSLPHDDSPEALQHMMAYYGLEIFADNIGSTSLPDYAQEHWRYCSQYHRPIYRPTPAKVKSVYDRCPKQSLFRSEFVENIFHDFVTWEFDDFGYWGSLMASSARFAEKCARKLCEHMRLGDTSYPGVYRCYRTDCTVHCRENILAASATQLPGL